MSTQTEFIGWHRRTRAARWKEICRAETESACWRLLALQAPADRQRELCVTAVGVDPNAPRPRPSPAAQLPFGG
jgi:hypothetical protein